MSAPYHFTPRIPSVPHSTPFSASTYKNSNSKFARPPINNPYDKFTQPEFDAWIGGITGALKRALGQEDEEFSEHKPNSLEIVNSRSKIQDYGDTDDSEFSDGAIDDSFAEIKARRATGKGKARDPREGPGLGKGNSSQPIEIVSSDEEDAEEAAEVELSMAVLDGTDSDKSDEEVARPQSEDEYSWERGGSSSQPIFSPHKSTRLKEAATEEEYGSDVGEQDEYDAEGAEYEEFDEGEYDEEEEEDEEDEEHNAPVRRASDEIIEIDSDSEGEVNEDGLSQEDLSSLPPKIRGKYLADDRRQQEEVGEGSDDYEEYEEDEDRYGTSQLLFSRNQIGHPQNDQYEDNESADIVDADANADDDDEIQEIQPPESDTSFPLKPSMPPADKKHIKLPDPWSGPRTYAEDYFSGGDFTVLADKNEAHNLGPLDVEPENALVSEAGKDADIEQQAEQDTSFPPRDENIERPVDIADPWEGPQTYAEDFYSGGPVYLPQGTHTTAHSIGPMDVDYVEELDASATTQDNDEELHSQNEHASFPDDASDGIPVEIQDPWSGPQTYAEDYYSGGDVGTTPGVPLDPNLLSGTGEVEDDIDSFLTPGALTPSQGVEEHNEGVDDEEEAEEDDEEGSIVPPTNYIASEPHPNPDDAEYITANDSNEEQEPTVSQVDKGNDVESDKFDLVHPAHLNQTEEALNVREYDEALEEVDELDEDVVIPIAQTLGEEGDILISNTLTEERGHNDVQSSEQAIELEAPSVQELLDITQDQQTEGHSPITGEVQDVNSPVIISECEPVPEAGSEEPNIAEIGVTQEIPVDSTLLDISTKHAKPSRVAAETAPIIDERVEDDSHMDEKAQQEHEIMEGTSTHVVGTAARETAGTPSSEDEVGPEIEEIPTDVEVQTTANCEDILEASVIDEEIPMATVGDTTELDEDDIRSTPGLEDKDDLQTSAHPAASDVGQNTDQSPTAPPVLLDTEETISAGGSSQGYKVANEEVRAGDVETPEPPEDTLPGLSKYTDSETLHPVDHVATMGVPGINVPYLVDGDTFMDDDADGDIDEESSFDYIEVKSVTSEQGFINPEPFYVEESRTEGRLTVEPSDRRMSLDVVSVGSQDIEDDQNITNSAVDDDFVSLSTEQITETDGKTTSESATEKIGVSVVAELTQIRDLEDTAQTASGFRQPEISMPVTADPDALDPTDRTEDGSKQAESGSNAVHHQPQDSTIGMADEDILDQSPSGHDALPTTSGSFDTLAKVDGLFTPAEPTVNSTEYNLENAQVLTELAKYMFGSGRHDTVLNQSDVSVPAAINEDVTSTSNLNTPDQTSFPPSTSQPNESYPVPPVNSHTLRGTAEIPLSGSFANSTEVNGSTTRAESAVNLTEHDLESRQILTEMAKYMFGPGTSNATSSITEVPPSHESPSSLPEVPIPLRLNSLPSATGNSVQVDDVFGEVPSDTVNGTHDDTSLPHRAPSVSMRVTLSQKPTDPVLMADPYPYCLSTPGPSVYPGQDETSHSSKDDENLVQQGSTVLKEDEISTVNLVEGEITTSAISYLGDDRLTLPSSSSVGQTVAEGSTTKRKRGTSAEPFNNASTPVRAQKGKGRKGGKVERKGKGQPTKNIVPEPTSEETIHVKPRPAGKIMEYTNRAASVTSIQGSQVSSGASAAYKMLQPGSRSSSVSSAVPDNKSVASQPSPTVNKPGTLPLIPTVNLESLFHAHGQKKKALALTIQHSSSPRSQSKKPQLSRFPSTSSIPDQPSPTSSTTALSPVVPPPTKSDTSAKTTTTPSRLNFSTPVTRSHCRYHRISLPKEEGGTRVNFLVPGCSLNDKELMDEEEIVDHGDATVDDSRNMVKDIENLGFSLDLIGIIRQLVGLDILREQEVFYLPQPGEVVTWKKAPLQKSTSERAAMVRAPGETSSHAGSPGSYSGPGITVPVSNRHPLSHSSYSSTPSVESAFIHGSAPSFKTEQSDDEEHATKRLRPSPPGEPGVMGPPAQQSKGRPLKPRRSTKIDLTYEPGEEDQDEESDHENLTARKRRKSTRGLKRSRTSEVVLTGENDEPGRESKKMRPDSTTIPESEPQSEPLIASSVPEQPSV